MDDYIALKMGRRQSQLRHIETGVMAGIYEVFPQDVKDEDDPISLLKIIKIKGRGMWSNMHLVLTLMENLGNTLSG